MLLLTQGGEIINLDRMAIIDISSFDVYDTSNFNVYARQDINGRGILLGGYDSESRCHDVISEIYESYSKGSLSCTIPQK